MKKRVLVIAPHPDDETLGCGGTILKHRRSGEEVHWLIATAMTRAGGFAPARIARRKAEIRAVAGLYGFESVREAGFPAARLEGVPVSRLIAGFGAILGEVRPDWVYLPHRGDIHTDHRVVFDAAASCLKWFRGGPVERVLSYETLSETDLALDPGGTPFRPNVFVDVSEHLDRKIAIMKVYGSEMGPFPFPRSPEAIRALAAVRGASSGFRAAEAFMLLREARP